MLMGVRVIHLLYGNYVKLMDNLLLTLLDYLKNTVPNKLIIFAKSKGKEDCFLYKHA